MNKELQHCLDMGYDSIINGSTTTNCSFSLFSSPEKTKAWEKGREKAKNDNNKPIRNRMARRVRERKR